MSCPPADWSFTQPYGDFEDEEDVPPPPPPPSAKKGRPALDDMKAAARQKLESFESMFEASRFLTSALEVHLSECRADFKKIDARKPRSASKTTLPPLPPAPAPSKASVACEDAAVSKVSLQSVKRMRATPAEAPVRQDGGRGAAGGFAVHYHDPQGGAGGNRGAAPRPYTGVLNYKSE